MNGILFGFEFAFGIALFALVAWGILRWFQREKQPKVGHPLTLRDWLWLTPVFLAIGYLIAAALRLTK